MIKTERLNLIPCELKHFEAFARGGENELARLLGASVADGWLVFPEAMSFGYEFLKANPDAGSWWMYLFVKTDEKKLVGNGGFKGKPDASGVVEIGYAIAPGYEGQGLATEAAKNLIDYAFSNPQVQIVQAHTLAEENASVKVLRKLGMTFARELHDEEDGDIWQWRKSRA